MTANVDHCGKQTGSTLIEVLVALLILAVGLLGMAGLQTLSLRHVHDAYLRTQATILAVDLAERVRAVGRSGAGADHSSDLVEWRQTVAAELPSGKGELCVDATPDDGTPALPACDGLGRLLAVKVWWDAARDGQGEQRLAMGFRL